MESMFEICKNRDGNFLILNNKNSIIEDLVYIYGIPFLLNRFYVVMILPDFLNKKLFLVKPIIFNSSNLDLFKHLSRKNYRNQYFDSPKEILNFFCEVILKYDFAKLDNYFNALKLKSEQIRSFIDIEQKYLFFNNLELPKTNEIKHSGLTYNKLNIEKDCHQFSKYCSDLLKIKDYLKNNPEFFINF